MLAAVLYKYVYLLFCTIATFQILPKARVPGISENKTGITFSPSLIPILAVLILFIGTRPLSFVFSDTMAYAETYHVIMGSQFYFDPWAENLLFDNLFSAMACFNFPIWMFFTLIATIYFVCILVACIKLFPNNVNIAFVTYLVAFSTFTYGTNGVKAGAGAALFLIALAYRDKLWISIPFVLLSIGFHHSMKVVAYAFVLAYFVKNTKLYFYGWFFCLAMAVLHVGFFQELFASYTDESGAEYLIGSGAFQGGFRPDFILYSAAPVYIGYRLYIKNNLRNAIYEWWLRMYLLMNGVWMLCMYASFTNRIAYLSWFMYPFVLIYPYYAIYTSNQQGIEGKKVIKYHLYFTLFMEIIYYNIIK